MSVKKELMKKSAILLVKEHKGSCDNPECEIQLYYVRLLLDEAGVGLSEGEKALFI